MSTSKYKVEITGKDKSKAAFNSMNKSMGNADKAVRSMSASIGVLLGGAGIIAVGKAAIDSADKIQKMSIRLGITTEALSQYQHVAKLSGVSFETLTMGWQRMTRRVAEAAQGTGEAKNALKELGLSAVALARLRPEQQFEVLTEALNGVENQSDKVRLAMKLFDSEGVSLLQTMEQGSAGLREMTAEADALGLTLSGDAANAAARANDELTRMGASVTSLTTTFVTELGPAIGDAVQWLNEALPSAIDSTRTAVDIVIAGFARVRVGMAALTGDQEGIRFWISVYDEALQTAVERTTKVIEVSNSAAEANTRFSETYAQVTDGVVKYNAVAEQSAKALELVNADLDRLIKNQTLFGEAVDPSIEVMDRYTQSLMNSQLQMDLMADKQLIAFELWQNGAISVEVYQATIESLGNAMPEVAEKTIEAASIMEDAWQNMTENMQLAFGDLIYDNIQSALEDGKLSFAEFTDTLKDLFFRMLAEMAAKLAASAVLKFFTGFGGGSSGGGGAISGFLGKIPVVGGILGGAASLFGFAGGGQFDVGGTGGTDSQLVQFKASPNERVTIETPAQQQRGQQKERAVVIQMSGDMGGLEKFIKVIVDGERVKINRSSIRPTESVY